MLKAGAMIAWLRRLAGKLTRRDGRSWPARKGEPFPEPTAVDQIEELKRLVGERTPRSLGERTLSR
jgi:hypothetical protein